MESDYEVIVVSAGPVAAIILTGDAAFFINPLTGGGIYNAMMSGKLSAFVSSDCLKKMTFLKNH